MKFSLLEQNIEGIVQAFVQPQKVCHSSKMIDTPESLHLPLGISTLEPRKTERPGVESRFCVSVQDCFRLVIELLEYHKDQHSHLSIVKIINQDGAKL